MLDKDNNEIDLRQNFDDEISLPAIENKSRYDDEAFTTVNDAEGAAGYLPKDVDQDRLSEAIKIAAAGGAFVREQFQSTPSLLTVREMDVLRLLAQGKQRDQIAAALGIGAESVKTHLKGIMNKLACPNATSAVGRAYELGILRA